MQHVTMKIVKDHATGTVAVTTPMNVQSKVTQEVSTAAAAVYNQSQTELAAVQCVGHNASGTNALAVAATDNGVPVFFNVRFCTHCGVASALSRHSGASIAKALSTPVVVAGDGKIARTCGCAAGTPPKLKMHSRMVFSHSRAKAMLMSGDHKDGTNYKEGNSSRYHQTITFHHVHTDAWLKSKVEQGTELAIYQCLTCGHILSTEANALVTWLQSSLTDGTIGDAMVGDAVARLQMWYAACRTELTPAPSNLALPAASSTSAASSSSSSSSASSSLAASVSAGVVAAACDHTLAAVPALATLASVTASIGEWKDLDTGRTIFMSQHHTTTSVMSSMLVCGRCQGAATHLHVPEHLIRGALALR